MIGPHPCVSNTAPGKHETPRVQGFCGDGASRARTGDLLHAMQIRPKPAYLRSAALACNTSRFRGVAGPLPRNVRTAFAGRLGHDWATA